MTGARESRRVVLTGIIVIAAVFIAQGALGFLVTREAQARASRLEHDSLLSVEQVARIGHDLDQQRILIDRHIEEADAEKMGELDRRLGATGVDLQHAIALYSPLVELPDEAAEWRQARAAIERLNATLEDALQLSRRDLDVEARAQLLATRDEYETLELTLARLIELNRDSALEAMAQSHQVEEFAESVSWGVRLLALLVVAIVGVSLVRQVSGYEKQVRDYSGLVEARNRDLDAFAGRVAHDLKNALAPILLSTPMLRRAATNPGRVVELVDRADRSAQRAIGIIEALLTFSRAETAGGERQAALQPALDGVVEEVAPRAHELGATLDVEPGPPLTVACDPGLLHVLLVNLVGNAVKYLDGCPERRVRLAIGLEGDAARIDVEDTGPGIPAHALARIFEAFYRVEGARAPGLGIGLATVRRILDACHGRIEVASTEGRGSRFRIWLPLAGDAAQATFANVPDSSTGRQTQNVVP